MLKYVLIAIMHIHGDKVQTQTAKWEIKDVILYKVSDNCNKYIVKRELIEPILRYYRITEKQNI